MRSVVVCVKEGHTTSTYMPCCLWVSGCVGVGVWMWVLGEGSRRCAGGASRQQLPLGHLSRLLLRLESSRTALS